MVDYGMILLPEMKTAMSCCGLLCVKQNILQYMTQVFIKTYQEKKYIEYWHKFNERTCLVNSFYGLEKAMAAPPNYVYTGPLSPPQENLMVILQQKDEALFNWLNEAQEQGIPVAYVSLGSICKWMQWSIDAFFYGL